jgi:hypothetical protein
VKIPVLKSEQEVLTACGKALYLAPLEWPSNLPPSEKLMGAPEWYPFERETWAIGESVRRAFIQHPALKKKTALVSRVTEVAIQRNLRRGRQAFVMAMGFVAARPRIRVQGGSIASIRKALDKTIG